MIGQPADETSRASAQPVWSPDDPSVLEWLTTSEITDCQLLPWGSNYTFVVVMDAGESGKSLGIYKPRRGEAPLHDFPSGTLYQREYASYLVSQALGWAFIPPTVVRDGPHGIGTVQLFIPSVEGAHYFTFQAEREDDLKPICAFDCVTNNADRKGGHCLLGLDGKVWGIDHGLTFNEEYKLRTVIWEYSALPIPDHLVADMATFLTCIEHQEPPFSALSELMNSREMEALCRRLRKLIETARFPEPGPWRNVPYPRV